MTGCPDCGATTNLGPDGACSWRAGCEHRAMQAEARSARAKADDDRFLELLGAEAAFWMDPLPCGHTAAEHAGAVRSTGTLTDAAEWGRIVGTLWTSGIDTEGREWVSERQEFRLNWETGEVTFPDPPVWQPRPPWDAPEVDGDGYTRGDGSDDWS